MQFSQVCEGSIGISVPSLGGPTFGVVNSDSIPTYTNPSWFVSDLTSISIKRNLNKKIFKNNLSIFKLNQLLALSIILVKYHFN
jgi:hypothetical protein